MRRVVIVVDVQRDFCEGGALAASDTPSLLEPLRRFVDTARQRGELIVFTQDWHPDDHSSFQSNGGPWAVHCVAGSRGAELVPSLVVDPNDLIIRKGTSRDQEGYSAFQSTRLAPRLRSLGIESIAICGIATDYCVRATALDAQGAGFKVTVLTDLVRAVDNNTFAMVLSELRNAGIDSIDSRAWLNR